MANASNTETSAQSAAPTSGSEVMSLFELHKNKIYGALGLILFIVVAVYAYSSLYKGPREKEANEEIFKAQQVFERDSFNLALAGSPGNFKGFLDIIEEYSGTEAANLSYYYAGVCLLQTGQFDKAIEFLGSYSGGDALTQAMAYGMLGDAYSENKNMDEAVRYYEKAANQAKSEAISAVFLHKAALLSEMQENKEKAVAYLRQAIKDYPNAAERLYLEKDLLRISGEY